MCAKAAGMTFLLREINIEGDYRHLDGDTQMRQNPGRLLEGWQPTSNNRELQTAVLKLIFYGSPSKTARRDLATQDVVDVMSTKLRFLHTESMRRLSYLLYNEGHGDCIEPLERVQNNSCQIQSCIVYANLPALTWCCEWNGKLGLPNETSNNWGARKTIQRRNWRPIMTFIQIQIFCWVYNKLSNN